MHHHSSISALAVVFSILAGSPLLAQPHGVTVSGVVRDPAGASVSEATVTLRTPARSILVVTQADEAGAFDLRGIAAGTYVLEVRAHGFEVRHMELSVRDADLRDVQVRLTIAPIHEDVTVAAEAGAVRTATSAVQAVTTIGSFEIAQRAKSVVAQVANEAVGVALQRTSPTMAGIFVRGLTGKNVNVYVDGVRYSTSAQRGGVNTFLDLIEPATLDSVEIVRGPNSAQYGSDSLGGSVQFFSKVPSFSTIGAPSFRGSVGTTFNSADLGFGSDVTGTYAGERVGLMMALAGRRVNMLRPGGGIDSHNAVTRFFGLPSTHVVNGRLPDTAFTQYGGLFKLNWAPTTDSQLVVSYTRGQQDGGKRYDQLLGGDGNLIADLRNLMLDLGSLRYERSRTGWFDRVTATYSFNSQREERVNQGGNGNPLASITHEPERTTVNGVQASAGKQIGARRNLLVGGEYYHEAIAADSFVFNPVSGLSSLRRGRVPDGARYRSGGVYAQESFDAVADRLRLVGNLRVGRNSYESRSADSPLVNGAPLWPDDALDVSSVTFRAGIVGTPHNRLTISAHVSRGFRAPHVTDLGTLGLTGSGFEVAAPDVAGLGGTIGTNASAAALSTGRPVEQLRPETSLNYDVAFRYRSARITTDLTLFLNDISDNIQKQALILPQGAVGQLLGGTPITAQTANGAVFVAVSTAPVLVRSNFDDARLRGVEQTFDWRISRDWSAATVFTFVHVRDKSTGQPPNIEGGTPAPDGYLKIRFAPQGGAYWVEPYVHLAARQSRLSTLDLEDRRTGATRSRSNIRNFFVNGATARGLVAAGPDGVFGTADDVLVATGETLAQVQTRVLGGEASAPLFTSIPGYVVFSLRAGWRFGVRHEVMLDAENIGDRNYRGISWGLDAPGRGVAVRYRTTF